MIDMRKGNYRAVVFSVQRAIFPLPPTPQLFGEGVTQPLIVAFRIECTRVTYLSYRFKQENSFFLYTHGFMLQYVATVLVIKFNI